MSERGGKGEDGVSPVPLYTAVVTRIFGFLHGLIAALFVCAALILIAVAVQDAWVLLSDGLVEGTAMGVIETLGVAAVAVVALQIAQTIAEEEVIREAHVSGPTRVRRFLSRFLVVVVVAVSIEGLIATFKALREAPSDIPYAATILVAVAFLLAGWGVFVFCNRKAEELEPEAMAQAKKEDRKLR